MIREDFWTEDVHCFDAQHVTVSLTEDTVKSYETD